MKFSIIIPTYNSEKTIARSIISVLNQTYNNLEIIIVDDCSIDNTLNIVKNIKDYRIKIYKTNINSGPGIARNIGIEKSEGDWILFLDSDDELENFAISELHNFIKENNLKNNDIIAYNWKFINKNIQKFEGRYDFNSLKKEKIELIKDFISLGMDGSVIYTLFPTYLLKYNNIKFENGYHEDIYFIFQAYVKAQKIHILDKKIYKKFNRSNSIINTISKKHIDDYFKSFIKIYEFLKKEKIFSQNIKKHYIIGIINIIAVEILNIYRNCVKETEQIKLYKYLYEKILQVESLLSINLKKKIQTIHKNTKYFMIVNYFLNNIDKQITKINKFLKDISKKSWSCYDLHNSLFLSYNEIRTCCKRFFDNGKMKGDIVLLNANKENITPENILKAKQNLYYKINRDEAEECKNCPFLEFKEWGYIDKLNVEHLSLEYHSICNMKCIYCSEIYYGGEKPKYNVKQLIQGLYENNSLKKIKSIVWGGGEPTLDKNFLEILNFIIKKFPKIKPIIITNATKYVPEICNFLKENKIRITTSIDAGIEKTFFYIRNSKSFYKIFNNLQKYSKCDNDGNITIKYIILDENKDLNNIKNFVNLINKYNLIKNNFQISFNFKKEIVDIDSIVAIIILYTLLKQHGANIVFLDDLLRQRLKIDDNKYNELIKKLKNYGYDEFLFNPNLYKKVIIWGAGVQTKQLLTNSYLIKKTEIAYIVDDTSSKIGKNFFGYPVYSSNKLVDDNYPIIISASQNTPLIIKKFNKLGINKNRLIEKVII
ncbi:glycosyltransferase [Lebetimonas natsushimae]|nr:glycosyltransferase [Lebetimonas natsushimae]